MSIHPRDILFYGGGAALQKFGSLCRRTTVIGRRGEDVIETFARTGMAAYIARDGTIQLAAANVPRVDWVDADGDGILDTPVLILEDAATNLCPYSDALSNLTAVGSPTTSDAAVSLGELDLCLVGDDDGAATEGLYATISSLAPGSTAKGLTAYVKEGTSPPTKSTIELYDSWAAASRLQMDITFSDGVPVVTETLGTLLDSRLISDGVYRLDFQSTAVTPVNTHRIYIYPANGGASETGNIYIGGVQVEATTFPTSRILTAGATATRNAESLSFPFFAPPQEMTIYTRFVERQEPNFDGEYIWIMGGSSLNYPFMRVVKTNPSLYQYIYQTATTGENCNLSLGPGLGDLVELRAHLLSDGSVQLHGALNDGSESSGTASSSGVFGIDWYEPLMYVGARGSYDLSFNGLHALVVARGSHSLADFRALLP